MAASSPPLEADHAASAAAADGARADATGAAAATADPVATGAQQASGSTGALPFTGLGLALMAGLGLLVFAAGLALRRTARRVSRPGA